MVFKAKNGTRKVGTRRTPLPDAISFLKKSQLLLEMSKYGHVWYQNDQYTLNELASIDSLMRFNLRCDFVHASFPLTTVCKLSICNHLVMG